MRVIVIGGGITGLFVAYYLRKSGYDATIVDRTEGKVRTSVFNAGLLTPSFAPAPPIGLAKIASTLFGPRGAIYISPREVLKNIGWFWTALRSGLTTHQADIMKYAERSLELYREFFASEAIEADVVEGVLSTYVNSQDAERYAKELGGKLLGEKETTEMGLRGFGGGVLLEKELSLNPAKLLPNMTKRLTEMGVRFESIGESKLVTESGTVKAVEADGKRIEGDCFVVTAGAWCRNLLHPLGFDPKVLPARGMVMIFDTNGKRFFDHGFLFEDYGIGLVQHNPTTLRLTSFFELTGFNEAWKESRKRWLLQTTERHFSQLGSLKCVEEGMGYRPCTPDQLPVLGAIPGYGNLFMASGNCRLGLTLGPVTGHVTASLIRGENPQDLPWRFFEASRFGGPHQPQ